MEMQMKMLTRTIGAVALSLAFAAPAAFAADTADLAPKYKTGDKATYKFDLTRNEKTVIASTTSPLSRVRTITQSATFDMKVTEASESGTTITLTLKDATCKVQDPEKSLEFSSSKPADDSDAKNELVKALRPVVGATLTFKFDAQGNVLSCSTDAELVKASQFTQVAEQLVSDQWGRMRWSTVFFPKAGNSTVKAGETWKTSCPMTGAAIGKFQADMDYTVKSVSPKQTIVEMKGAFTMEPDPKKEKVAKTSSVSGSMAFDPTARVVTTSETNEKMEMQVSAQGIAVDRDTDTQVKITRAN